MCLAGIFTAMVFVVTAYLHVPTYNGYVHFGDGFIFLAACMLPMPYSICILKHFNATLPLSFSFF